MEKKKHNPGGRSISDYMPAYHKQAYNYWSSSQLESVIPQTESKKVTNTVGTFWSEGRNVSRNQPLKRSWKRLPIWWEPFGVSAAMFQESATQTESKKVTNMVGTFWN